MLSVVPTFTLFIWANCSENIPKIFVLNSQKKVQTFSKSFQDLHVDQRIFLRIHLVYLDPCAGYSYLLLTEFEGRTGSYGPSFFPFDLWPKREARRP